MPSRTNQHLMGWDICVAESNFPEDGRVSVLDLGGFPLPNRVLSLLVRHTYSACGCVDQSIARELTLMFDYPSWCQMNHRQSDSVSQRRMTSPSTIRHFCWDMKWCTHTHACIHVAYKHERICMHDINRTYAAPSFPGIFSLYHPSSMLSIFIRSASPRTTVKSPSLPLFLSGETMWPAIVTGRFLMLEAMQLRRCGPGYGRHRTCWRCR